MSDIEDDSPKSSLAMGTMVLLKAAKKTGGCNTTSIIVKKILSAL
jgi:hypothetical protein